MDNQRAIMLDYVVEGVVDYSKMMEGSAQLHSFLLTHCN
jgi:hypothetical protein